MMKPIMLDPARAAQINAAWDRIVVPAALADFPAATARLQAELGIVDDDESAENDLLVQLAAGWFATNPEAQRSLGDAMLRDLDENQFDLVTDLLMDGKPITVVPGQGVRRATLEEMRTRHAKLTAELAVLEAAEQERRKG